VSVFAAGALLFAACSDSDDGGGSDTTASETTETTEAPSGAWAVSTEDCADPDAAVAPISGTLKVERLFHCLVAPQLSHLRQLLKA